MEPQEPSNSPESGPEVVEGQRVAKERAAQRARSWTVQNEMRDVRGECPQALQEGFLILPILDSKNLKKGCVRCSEDERGHSEHDEGAQVPRWKSREPVCQRILMRQYASSPRKENSGYDR